MGDGGWEAGQAYLRGLKGDLNEEINDGGGGTDVLLRIILVACRSLIRKTRVVVIQVVPIGVYCRQFCR